MTWPQAMGMCVMYGVVIMLLVVTGLREMIMNAIPLALKHAITMGIGMFVALLGLVKAGFVGKGEGGPVQLGATGQLVGWPVLFFCVTLLLIFMMQARKIPGAILIGIVAGTVLSIVVTQDRRAHRQGLGRHRPRAARQRRLGTRLRAPRDTSSSAAGAPSVPSASA